MAFSSPFKSCLSICTLSGEISRFSTSTVGTPPRKSIWSDSMTACAISCWAWISSSFWIESNCAPLIVEACFVYLIAAEYSHSRSLLSSANSFFMVIFIWRLLLFGVRVVYKNGGLILSHVGRGASYVQAALNSPSPARGRGVGEREVEHGISSRSIPNSPCQNSQSTALSVKLRLFRKHSYSKAKWPNT